MNEELMATKFTPRHVQARSMTFQVASQIGTFWMHNQDEYAHLDRGGLVMTTLNENDMTVTISRAGGETSFNVTPKTTKKVVKQLTRVALHEIRNYFYA